MNFKQLLYLILILFSPLTLSIPLNNLIPSLHPRQSCENTPTSRNCWGEFSTSTNYYDVTPTTNVTREYWLSVQQGPCAPDGHQRTCMTFNGTIPGPTLIADWGDNLIIHVTNNLPQNGTSIHWHGIRQFGNSLNDGVPGVTQCAIPPNETMTYRFRVTQYGSTWYHSHFSLQYSEGLFGGMIFNGPTTANYDVDLGNLFLQDWGHTEVFKLWNTAKMGAPPILDGGLVNGTNTCQGDGCVDAGSRFEVVFEQGQKYLLRLVNVAVDGVFQFSIDGHGLTVVGHDLIPVIPYTAESVELSVGQRVDVIVEANAAPGNYWLRAGWINNCAANGSPEEMTGIVRYNARSEDDPTSESTVTPSTSCLGEPSGVGVPAVSIDVENFSGGTTRENLGFTIDGYFKWTINTSSLVLDWGNPTLEKIFAGEDIFPTEYNVVSVEPSGSGLPEWQVLVIQDASMIGISHPIHLHGHDFWVLAQETGMFNGSTSGFNTANPSRRDTATLPDNGYLAIAFLLDNPGAWLVHCHIAWHASQGLSLEFVESQDAIEGAVPEVDMQEFERVCASWDSWTPIWEQDDSGI
ncbi:multicopper oxidase-domain-containing protein [Podospora fimiseda]|uniref:Multicopper oxidase-domain-containing protein n=1 Tax=Podospora fimiseda TaxID=252190 RepID=A0AAN7BEL6_9PEZI|nr:multicopper oxidase-domain-containing protein [Podospora fimiseda]